MSRPLTSILIFILLVYTSSSGQISPGARQVSLSHADIAQQTDVFSLFINPSGLALTNNREIGIYYSPSPFGLKELANGYAAYVEPSSIGNLSIGFSTYGFELYKEQKIYAGFAKNFDKKYFLGISFIYQTLKIQNYGSDGTFNFIVGGSVNIIPNLYIGFSAENLLQATYGNSPDQIPVLYNIGAAYNFKNASIFTSLQKEIGFPVSPKFGIECLPIEFLALRIGTQSNPETFSGGIGIFYSIFNFDYAVNSHPDLGLTHQVGVIIKFENPSPIF